jgi:hypothetical protein
VLLIVGLFPVTTLPQTAEPPERTANEFARTVLANEVKAEVQDHSHWMLRLETETPRGKQVDEVVETKYGALKRHILVNGQPLNAGQQHAEDERIRMLAQNSDALRRSMRTEKEDSDRSQKMLRMLPDALMFSLGERNGDTVKLNFTSNPKFRPPSHEAQVFQALQGEMWVDIKQRRLVGLAGHLHREVKFGGGWLGHLNQGGQFEVKQAEVSAGYWELTSLNVNMKGKALFFKTIDVQQKMSRSNFRRVPDDLTLHQAADMLQKPSVLAKIRFE